MVLPFLKRDSEKLKNFLELYYRKSLLNNYLNNSYNLYLHIPPSIDVIAFTKEISRVIPKPSFLIIPTFKGLNKNVLDTINSYLNTVSEEQIKIINNKNEDDFKYTFKNENIEISLPKCSKNVTEEKYISIKLGPSDNLQEAFNRLLLYPGNITLKDKDNFISKEYNFIICDIDDLVKNSINDLIMEILKVVNVKIQIIVISQKPFNKKLYHGGFIVENVDIKKVTEYLHNKFDGNQKKITKVAIQKLLELSDLSPISLKFYYEKCDVVKKKMNQTTIKDKTIDNLEELYS